MDITTTNLTPMEADVVKHIVLGKTPKSVSSTLGIPVTTIQRLIAKKEVSEMIDEMVTARNKAMVAYLPTLLMDIIEDKVREAEEEDKGLAGASKRDVADIAKILSDIVKNTSSSTPQEANGLTAFYQTFNMVAKQDN